MPGPAAGSGPRTAWSRGQHRSGAGGRHTGDGAWSAQAAAAVALLVLGSLLLAVAGWWRAEGTTDAASAVTAPSTGPAARAAARVVVQPGDTLWTLAVRYGPPGEDPRRLVWELAEVNGLDPAAVLLPARGLRLPSRWAAPGQGRPAEAVSRAAGAGAP
ncbi:MAG TPA: LysM domain-containing protein [Limnochordales bacterium]